ncbi:MAG: inosine/xanthosine triphosphatase [Anaerolineales bacterium]|nr:inosine/xanthosine triphosphatase [Anaerolineales bacterium]
MMKIAVGSTNPVKVEAVRLVAAKIWPEVVVVPTAVPSGVSEMPMSDAECIVGARNRALAARETAVADFGIGLEGGVAQESFGLTLVGWVVLVGSNGRESIGGCPRLPLPPRIAQRVLAGEELGPVMDSLVGQQDVKKKGGAVGTLTNGLVMRQEAFATAVAYAFAPFVTPHFYTPS